MTLPAILMMIRRALLLNACSKDHQKGGNDDKKKTFPPQSDVCARVRFAKASIKRPFRSLNFITRSIFQAQTITYIHMKLLMRV